MSGSIGRLGCRGVALGLTAFLAAVGVLATDGGRGRVVQAAQKVQKKKTSSKKDAGTTPAPAAKPATPPAEGSLSFKSDIAPILVANCLGCHSANGQGVRRSKFDMSTFDKLMAGGNRGKDILGGNPEESPLVQMIKGEETPKMPPPGGQRGFADEAVAKIVEWVKQGARLDAGLSATDPINKYAATLDDLRRSEMAKLSPDERDKITEQAGRERWKKASKLEPELTTTKGGHFLLLSTLPKERANKLLTALEAQYKVANQLFSSSRTPVLNPVEKIGVYVFKEQGPFVEFVRGVENSDVEAGEQARSKLSVESPYLVAFDPVAGGEEAAPAPKKGVRGKKKADSAPSGPDRTLAGLLTEQLISGTAGKAGKPPRWITLGLGAFMASKLEPGSPYYRSLRREAAECSRIGWQAKANGALGGEEKTETIRAIGFALFEWMSDNVPTPTVSAFVQAMLEGQGKTDDAIAQCFSGTRQEFLDNSNLWVSEKYGPN